jgi:uncharacterized protein (TIGR02145 family)
MRHLLSSALAPCLTLCLALLFAFQLSAQTEPTLTYPYNPDIDADQNILLDDLLEILVVYGNAFEVSEIMVDNQTLTEYLSSLNLLIEAIAMPDGTETGQFLRWDGSSWVLVIPSVGCTDSEACNYDPLATTNYASLCLYLDACGVCSGPGTIYECGCEDIPEGDCDCDGNQLDALNVCGGTCSADLDGDGICDDGDSCIGQADVCGVCNGPGAIYDCGCSGIPEGDCDCNGTPDADGDGVCDTEDDCVGTLDAAGVCNGDCVLDADGDGICDDDGNDTCDGTVDACGVCNGPGPIYECGCADMAEGACDCAGNTPDIDGNCQDCLSDTDGDGLYDDICGPCLGETSITYNGVVYGLVEIGGKCWFKENLRTTSYRSGTSIPNTADEGEWNALGHSGGYCAYDNDPANTSTYGLLYNGYTTVAPEGVCPQYYAVPTVEEWDALITELGGASLAGGALKESGLDHWASPNTGATNSSGFTALPGGERGTGTLGFMGMTESSIFWSKPNYSDLFDEVDNVIQVKLLSSQNASVTQEPHSKVRGHSIRCLRSDGVLGCTDQNFMEYNPQANVDDGSCSATAIIGCMNSLYHEYNPLANVDDGTCTYLAGCTPEDVISYDATDYAVVTIGTQCWFQENLKTTTYRNGDVIPNIQDGGEWSALDQNQTGAWASYNNSPSNEDTYGKLYNWYAVDDARALCPSGWNVPTDPEWTQLTDLLGGTSVAGYSLKSTTGWYSNGSNSSGFTALPGGYRSSGGGFSNSSIGYFWSSSVQGGSSAWSRVLDNFSSYVSRNYYNQHYGVSVRCLRD